MSKVFKVGNRMWVGSAIDPRELLATFEEKLASVYLGDVESLLGQQQQHQQQQQQQSPAEKVNRWVSQATEGKIPKLFGKSSWKHMHCSPLNGPFLSNIKCPIYIKFARKKDQAHFCVLQRFSEV